MIDYCSPSNIVFEIGMGIGSDHGSVFVRPAGPLSLVPQTFLSSCQMTLQMAWDLLKDCAGRSIH